MRMRSYRFLALPVRFFFSFVDSIGSKIEIAANSSNTSSILISIFIFVVYFNLGTAIYRSVMTIAIVRATLGV